MKYDKRCDATVREVTEQRVLLFIRRCCHVFDIQPQNPIVQVVQTIRSRPRREMALL